MGRLSACETPKGIILFLSVSTVDSRFLMGTWLVNIESTGIDPLAYFSLKANITHTE